MNSWQFFEWEDPLNFCHPKYFLTWDKKKFWNFNDIFAPKNCKKITDFILALILGLWGDFTGLLMVWKFSGIPSYARHPKLKRVFLTWDALISPQNRVFWVKIMVVSEIGMNSKQNKTIFNKIHRLVLEIWLFRKKQNFWYSTCPPISTMGLIWRNHDPQILSFWTKNNWFGGLTQVFLDSWVIFWQNCHIYFVKKFN